MHEPKEECKLRLTYGDCRSVTAQTCAQRPNTVYVLLKKQGTISMFLLYVLCMLRWLQCMSVHCAVFAVHEHGMSVCGSA